MPALSPFPAHPPAVCRHWQRAVVPPIPKGTEKSRFPGKLNPPGAETSCAYHMVLSRAGEGRGRRRVSSRCHTDAPETWGTARPCGQRRNAAHGDRCWQHTRLLAGVGRSSVSPTGRCRSSSVPPIPPSCPSKGGFCSLAKPRAVEASGHDTGQITEGHSSLV